MTYKTRKEQIEKDFLRTLMRDLRKLGVEPTLEGRALIREELRGAALVAAAEERQRTLAYLSKYPAALPEDISDFIVSKGVLEVLGYKRKG